MKYVVAVLLAFVLISAACEDNQREAASPTQAPIPETAPSPTPDSPSAEEMLIDSQSARIADLEKNIENLEEDIENLELNVEELESKNQDAAQLIGDLEAESEEKGQLVEDLQSENSEMEEMLNDLRCRSHTDVELVPDGCDWEPPDSMPRQIGGWTWSKYDDGDGPTITYTVNGEGADSQSYFRLRLYCVWDVNSQVLVALDIGEGLHEAGEGTVNVEYRIGDTERRSLWSSWAGSVRTNLHPEWSYSEMVLDDLRTGHGTLEVTITADDKPPMQAVFEIDGIAEVLDLLEPGCGGTRRASVTDVA